MPILPYKHPHQFDRSHKKRHQRHFLLIYLNQQQNKTINANTYVVVMVLVVEAVEGN